MMAGFFKLKGVEVGQCPAIIRMVFRVLSSARPYKALKAMSEMIIGKGRSTVGDTDASHWWTDEAGSIQEDGYYFMAKKFLGSVEDVSVILVQYQLRLTDHRHRVEVSSTGTYTVIIYLEHCGSRSEMSRGVC
jgi:hypothetical protein